MKVAAPLNLTRSGHIVMGVDTHKHVHVAAVMDSIGGILASLTIETGTAKKCGESSRLAGRVAECDRDPCCARAWRCNHYDTFLPDDEPRCRRRKSNRT